MRVIQFREALREAMQEEMRLDPNVFLMGEEVAEYNGAYKVSQGMLEEFGAKRIIDTPIAELGFAGIGVGAAMNGLRPVIEFMTFNFSLVAIDQVINAAEGTDVTIVSFGKIMKVALATAEELAKEGISCEVIDLRTVRPIDYDTVINSVKKTNRLVIVEEAWPLASISTEITYMVQKNAFDYLDAPIRRICTQDTPLGYAPTFVQEFLPNVERTSKAIREVMYR